MDGLTLSDVFVVPDGCEARVVVQLCMSDGSVREAVIARAASRSSITAIVAERNPSDGNPRVVTRVMSDGVRIRDGVG